jgi:tRNA modification GTPase
VEALGIGLATSAARDADAVVYVVDASQAPGTDVLDAVRALDAGRTVVVLNKSDCSGTLDATAVKSMNPTLVCVTLSALTGEGIDGLTQALVSLVGGDRLTAMARERVVLNARLVSLLRSARACGDELRRSLESRQPLEMMAVEARDLLSYYEQATGRRYEAGLLDVIFSRFCIGK